MPNSHRWIITLLILLLASPAWAAIAEVGTSGATGTAVSATTVTHACDVGTGNDRVTMGCCVRRSTTDYTSVTLGGNAMTFQILDEGTGQGTEMWYYRHGAGAGTLTGSQNMVATGPSVAHACGCITYSGVHQTTTFGTPASMNGNAVSTFPLTVTSDLTQTVLSCFGRNDGASDTPVPDGSQTQQFLGSGLGAASVYLIGSTLPGASPSVAFDYSWDTTTYNGSHLGVALLPVTEALRRRGPLIIFGWLDSWRRTKRAWATGAWDGGE